MGCESSMEKKRKEKKNAQMGGKNKRKEETKLKNGVSLQIN